MKNHYNPNLNLKTFNEDLNRPRIPVPITDEEREQATRRVQELIERTRQEIGWDSDEAGE